jgi:two-component system, OmpR family, phosphate regulon sensor histidine kinase PhoR
MRRKTLLIFAALALTSIIGVVVIQVYWFRQAYNTNQEEFSKNTRIALKEVVKGILRYNNTHTMPADPIQQISPSYFVVMVNDRIDALVLEHYLQTELKRFNIKEGFEFSIYDCANQQMMYGEYSEGDPANTSVSINKHPQWKGDNYYFTVYFPHRALGLVGQMKLWIIFSAIVLVVVIFFTYSLFVILKQKRLSEIQRDFINNMAHEIRTPLSSIMVSAQTIKKPDMMNNPQRLLSYATIIQDEAGKLKTQVERVLSIAETENKIKLEIEDVNLHELIRQTVNTHIEQATNKRITLVMEPHALFFTMKGDPMHLANLFSNLVDNAIKYSHDNLTLRISTQNKNHSSIEVRIADNGVGISKENQKKIFDKFYRAPTGNVHNVKGFGIGLSYVSLVTRMHKGSIRVESETGQGSTFILTFPLQ